MGSRFKPPLSSRLRPCRWSRPGFGRRELGRLASTPSGWDALTPAENRVVDLAAQGFSNAEIAEQLLVGVSTVKTHLVHVYQKLDIDSRPALVAAAAGRPSADLRR